MNIIKAKINLSTNLIKSNIKHRRLLFDFFLIIFQNLAKFIDIFIIPIAIIYDRKGINVFEAKTRSFGHHLFEPIAVLALNNAKNKKDKKQLVLLAKQDKAYVKYTNTLLKQKFKIIQRYSYLNIYYWLARSKYCGLSHKQSYINQELDIFYKAHFKFRNDLDIFDYSELQNDIEINHLFKNLNPDNRFIVIWKPKCHREDKNSIFSSLRYSSLDSCKPLFDKIYDEGGIVFGLLYGDTNFKHHAVIDLRKIENQLIREKFVFYLDLNCKYAICGQNGGTIPLHILNKPIIVYDVSYPYTLNFCGTKTLISLKKATYKNGQSVRLENLVSLKLKEINKIIENKEIIFIPNSSDEIIEVYQELKLRLKKSDSDFKKYDYMINLDWKYKNFPKNIYNLYGYCQVADSCYKKQYTSLSPNKIKK